MQRQSILNFQKAIFLFLCFCCFHTATAQDSYISSSPVESGFPLNSVTLFLDSEDHEGVHLVAEDLQKDFEKVTGNKPEISSNEISGEYPVIVGTIGNSKLIDELISSDKLDVSEIERKWENFLLEVIDNPSPNVEKALVIAGSDKRGTIFGMYDISEKIGVSPWQWWADVPVKKTEELYVNPGSYTSGTPKVKYRGIFLNDEEPALGNWARETFGVINSKMYDQVFKLIGIGV